MGRRLATGPGVWVLGAAGAASWGLPEDEPIGPLPARILRLDDVFDRRQVEHLDHLEHEAGEVVLWQPVARARR